MVTSVSVSVGSVWPRCDQDVEEERKENFRLDGRVLWRASSETMLTSWLDFSDEWLADGLQMMGCSPRPPQ